MTGCGCERSSKENINEIDQLCLYAPAPQSAEAFYDGDVRSRGWLTCCRRLEWLLRLFRLKTNIVDRQT